MKRGKTPRVSIGLEELAQIAVARLNGCPVLMRDVTPPDSFYGKFGRYNGRPSSRNLAIALESAIYALEEFADEHGFVPWQPRFKVMTDEGTNRPAAPARWQKLQDMDAIEAVLKRAEQAAKGGRTP